MVLVPPFARSHPVQTSFSQDTLPTLHLFTSIPFLFSPLAPPRSPYEESLIPESARCNLDVANMSVEDFFYRGSIQGEDEEYQQYFRPGVIWKNRDEEEDEELI